MKTECQQFYNKNQIELPVMIEKVLKTSVKRKSKGTIEGQEMQMQEDGRTTDNQSEASGNITVADIYERDCNDLNEDKIKETFRPANSPERVTIKKKYPIDFKIKAIDDVEAEIRSGNDDEDLSVLKVSKDLEINRTLLCKWWTNRDKIKKVYQLNLKKSKMELGLETAVANNIHSIDNLLSKGMHDLTSSKKRTRVFCKTCPGCITPDCGECRNCKDKPKFNGPNKIRQRCIKKPPCQMREEKQRKGSLPKRIESAKDDHISNPESASEELSNGGSEVPYLTTHNVGNNAHNMKADPQIANETHETEEVFETDMEQDSSEWLDNDSYSNYPKDEECEPEIETFVEAKSNENESQCSSKSDHQVNEKKKNISEIEEEEEINKDINEDNKNNGEFNKTSESVLLEEKIGISSPVLASGKKKSVACKTCPGCVTPQCGQCKYCLDMPKFGGKGKMRQRCVLQACHLKMKDSQPRKRLSSKSKGPQKHSMSNTNSLSEITLEGTDSVTPDKKINAVNLEEGEKPKDKSVLKSDTPKISQHWWNSVPQLDEEIREHGQNNNLEKIERTSTSESNENINTENTVDTWTENKHVQNYGALEEQKVNGQETKLSMSNNVSPINFPMHLPPGLQIIPKKRKLDQESKEFPITNEDGFNVRSRNHPSVNNDNVTIEKVKKRKVPQPPVIKWKQETPYPEVQHVPSSTWASSQYPPVTSIQAHYQPGVPAQRTWPASPVPDVQISSQQMWPGQYYSGQQTFQNFSYQNVNYDGQTSGQTFTPSPNSSIKTEPQHNTSDTMLSQHHNDSVELEEYINNDVVLNILDSKKSLQPALNDIKQEVMESSNVMENSPHIVKMEQINSQSVIDYSQPSRRVVTMFPMQIPQPNSLSPQDDKLFTISRSKLEMFRSMSKLVVKNEMTLRDAASASGINKL